VKLDSTYYDALIYGRSTLKRKLLDHVGFPLEGHNITLKAELFQSTKNWSSITASSLSMNDDARPACPIVFQEDEVSECLRLDAGQAEADEQLQACRNTVGIGLDGWVPSKQYDEIKKHGGKLKADALEVADSEEERPRLCEH
jgi:hypothetical protein